MNLQTKLKKLQGAKSMYDFALDIGISASTLRNYYLGKRLLKWNFEKIKNMTVEEMANRFIPFNGKSYLGLNGQMYKKKNEAINANIKWLQSESEE